MGSALVYSFHWLPSLESHTLLKWLCYSFSWWCKERTFTSSRPVCLAAHKNLNAGKGASELCMDWSYTVPHCVHHLAVFPFCLITYHGCSSPHNICVSQHLLIITPVNGNKYYTIVRGANLCQIKRNPQRKWRGRAELQDLELSLIPYALAPKVS